MSSFTISYELETGDSDTAHMILDSMEEIAPDRQETRAMRQRVDGSTLMRALRKMARTMRRSVRSRSKIV
jgi:hypothetical protein